MESALLLILFTILPILVLFLLNGLRRKFDNAMPLPPGPKGFPLIGNINDMPKSGMLECYHWLRHKDLYGPISSVTVLGQTFVIINDSDIAFELMRDRSAIHSSRPVQIFSGEMVGWKHGVALCQYTNTWKIHRKNITKITGSTASVRVFDRVQEVEAAHFLLNVLDTPQDLFHHIRKEAGSVILKIIYGYTTETHGRDPFVELANKTMEVFTESTVPGKFTVDILPYLRYLPDWCPGTGFKKTARRMATQLRQCTNQPYEFVKQRMLEKKHKTSFLSLAIESIGSDPDMEFIHKWTALSLYLGGADTTVSSVMTFFLAMTVFPDAQKRAQDELDRVIGNSRLPVSADRAQLPYIEAIMKETHRWHPVLPMGVPHSSIAEDTCRGYRIPKGAMLLPNTWYFTHNPELYPDPMVFRPERHLDYPGHPAEPDPRQYIFGFGRRICPGRYVADNALFLKISQSLAVFKIEKFVENGKVVEPEVKFEPGVISHPLPYRTQVEARSNAHRRLIQSVEEKFPWERSDAEHLESISW
ncbi:cytochrome P450 [Clohesyomyces aquaticus]|uniref:Cytochrome P450 n=1 Tax=Clohesyomyces aquaticus TaxID=1231657 RepID=A0A1Y2A7T0_9PLEO|nr:cytochrome P450 [Clohesyomyces aquaticus]